MTTNALTATMPMTTASATTHSSSRAARITGYVLRGIAVAFLAMDTSMKLLQVAAAIEGTQQLGYPVGSIFYIGLLEAVLLLVYLVPRTSILGAVLWTGYLGGAVATHVRVGNPLFTHMLFPIYIAALLWGGLWLTDSRLRRAFDAK